MGRFVEWMKGRFGRREQKTDIGQEVHGAVRRRRAELYKAQRVIRKTERVGRRIAEELRLQTMASEAIRAADDALDFLERSKRHDKG
jgi:hypothetical protein